MLFLSLVAIMAYGPWQLWLLATPTRTVRFRTVLQAMAAGATLVYGVTVALEWAFVAAMRPRWDGTHRELVTWAGWTVDPFIEELVRLLPLVVVLVVVRRARRQWSVTDLVVVGAGTGSGFALVELLAFHAEEPRDPLGPLVTDGWLVSSGLWGTAWVPFPQIWLGQWLPPGVEAEPLLGSAELVSSSTTINVTAIWGAFGGLAVGLWLHVGRGRLGRRVLATLGGVGLIVFTGLAHAQNNADISGDDWPVAALDLPRFLNSFYWAWPLVVLGAALAIDWRVLSRSRGDPETLALRVGGSAIESSGRSDGVALLGLAMQRPWISISTVWSFVVGRRALLYQRDRQSVLPDPDLGDQAGPEPAGPSLFVHLEPLASGFRRQLDGNANIWPPLADRRRTLRRERRSAMLRSPLVWALGLLSLLAVAVPALFLVAGTMRGGHRLQTWFSGDGSWLMIVAAIGGSALGVVLLVVQVRLLGRISDVIGEPKARSVLSIVTRLSAIGLLAFGLLQVQSGAGLDQPVYEIGIFHGLNSLGELLWRTFLSIFVWLTLAYPPVGIPLISDFYEEPTLERIVERGTAGTLSEPPPDEDPIYQDRRSVGRPLAAAIAAAVVVWHQFGPDGTSDSTEAELTAVDGATGEEIDLPEGRHTYEDMEKVERWSDQTPVSQKPNRRMVLIDGVWYWDDTGDPVDRSTLDDSSPPAAAQGGGGSTTVPSQSADSSPSTTVPGDDETAATSNPSLRGLEPQGRLSDLEVWEQSYAEILIADPDITVIGMGDVAVREILGIPESQPAPDFLSIDSSGHFHLAEVKASFRGEVDVLHGVRQLQSGGRYLDQVVDGADVSSARLVVPKGATLDRNYTIQGDHLVRVTEDRNEVQRAAGTVVRVIEAELESGG